MASRDHQSASGAAGAGAGTAAAGQPAHARDAASVLERVLARGEDREPAGGGVPHEATVATWTGSAGTLSDGRTVGSSASCLLRPAPGDRVLVWRGRDDDQGWILAVLERASEDAPAVLATSGPLAIEAPRVGVAAQAVHLVSDEFLTRTRNRHAVEDTRTETARVRVAQVGTDIRRATHADDAVEGTFLQRVGVWISNTTREARFRARTFLFD